MSGSYMLLGPILFQDFELPATITWGGAQSLAIHQLPGGNRIIDVMGRDDADIKWSGVFSGPDACFRARALDLMRAEGDVWPLTWDGFFYTVIISHLAVDQDRPNWLPYRIACTVLRDEAASIIAAPLNAVSSVAADLSQATAFAPFAQPLAGPAAPIELSAAVALSGQAANQSVANAFFGRANRNVSLT